MIFIGENMKILINQKYISIVEAVDFNTRMKGLMGKENISIGMLFPKCNSIHTFFMKDNIDVIGLNENNEIIFIMQNVKKNKIIWIHHNIKKTSILELPKNTSKSLSLGMRLFFEFEDVV